MKIFLVLILGLSLLFTGCDKPAKKGNAAKGAVTYKVACGKCIYKEEAASGCPTWVKIDGKNYPVSGEGSDAHTAGLCHHERDAQIVGELKDGKFISTSMKVEDDGHNHGHKH